MNKPCSNNRVTDAAFLSAFFPNRTSSYIYFGRFCPKSSASNQKASNVLAMTPFLALFHSYPICMIWDMAFPPVVRSCSNISNSLLCRVIFFACCVHASRYTCIAVCMQADNTYARKKKMQFFVRLRPMFSAENGIVSSPPQRTLGSETLMQPSSLWQFQPESLARYHPKNLNTNNLFENCWIAV